jgi:hypothetical protein
MSGGCTLITVVIFMVEFSLQCMLQGSSKNGPAIACRSLQEREPELERCVNKQLLVSFK